MQKRLTRLLSLIILGYSSSLCALNDGDNDTGFESLQLGGQYQIQNQDTLWSLAGRLEQQFAITRHQAMFAILDLNPNAFVEGDLNTLQAGVLIDLPNRQQANQRSANDAAQQFSSLQQTPVNTEPQVDHTGASIEQQQSAEFSAKDDSFEVAEAIQDEQENLIPEDQLDSSLLSQQTELITDASDIAAPIDNSGTDIPNQINLQQSEQPPVVADAQKAVRSSAVRTATTSVQNKKTTSAETNFLPYAVTFLVVVFIVVFAVIKRFFVNNQAAPFDNSDSDDFDTSEQVEEDQMDEDQQNKPQQDSNAPVDFVDDTDEIDDEDENADEWSVVDQDKQNLVAENAVEDLETHSEKNPQDIDDSQQTAPSETQEYEQSPEEEDPEQQDSVVADTEDATQLQAQNDAINPDTALDKDNNLAADEDLLDLDKELSLEGELEEEMATKLALADAYIEMGDLNGARQLIEEILAEGDDAHKQAAQVLFDRLES